MGIADRLHELAEAEGIDLFGIADLSPAAAMRRFGYLNVEDST